MPNKFMHFKKVDFVTDFRHLNNTNHNEDTSESDRQIKR